VCLATVVANLTLLGARSGALNIGGLPLADAPMLALAAWMTLLFSLVSATCRIADSLQLDHTIHPPSPITRPLQASSRPRF